MKLFLRSFLIFSLICASFSLSAQSGSLYELKGLVKDSVSQETLPYANIFFSGTTYGTISDRNGQFRLRAEVPGTYELVVSFMGYELFRQEVDMSKPGVIQLEINLKPDSRELGAVMVLGKKNKKWKKNLIEFKRTFLGISSNAKTCKILNEEVLYFDYNEEGDILQAYADEPLIIENRALGYKVTYVLQDFKLFGQQQYFTFYGYPSFKSLETKKRRAKRWNLARDRSYYGSKNHFLKSLYQGTTTEAGYEVSQAIEMDGQVMVYKDEDFVIDSLVTFSQDGLKKELIFKNYLQVSYHNEWPEAVYLTTLPADATEEMRSRERQVSWFKMPNRTRKVVFEQSGYWVNSVPFTLMGYWGFEKVADLLPINYEPSR